MLIFIKHNVVLAEKNRIDVINLPPALHQTGTTAFVKNQRTILENEKQLMPDVLDECDWNKKEAARSLGISHSTLYDKLRRYQVPTTRRGR